MLRPYLSKIFVLSSFSAFYQVLTGKDPLDVILLKGVICRTGEDIRSKARTLPNTDYALTKFLES